MGRTRTRDKHLPRGVYFKHGAYWLVQYMDGKKKWTRLHSDYPKALAALSRRIEGAIPGLTVAALIARYEVEELPRRAPSTHRGLRSQMRRLATVFGEVRPDDIEPHEIWRYFRDRGETPGARGEVKQLRALMAFGIRIGARRQPNPCDDLEFPSSPPRERYVQDHEFLAVRALAPPMVAHAMNLALLCGMDRSTILSLERRNITEKGILFRRPKTEKHPSSREQLILWSDELRAEVDAILREDPRLRSALICTPKGTRYTLDGFSTAWTRTMAKAEKAGIENFHFHDLRAKSASEAKSDQAAADRLGHGDVQLTRRVYRRLPREAEPAALPGRIVDKDG